MAIRSRLVAASSTKRGVDDACATELIDQRRSTSNAALICGRRGREDATISGTNEGMAAAPSRDEVARKLRDLATQFAQLLVETDATKARPFGHKLFWEMHSTRLQSLPAYSDVLALVKAQPAIQEDARVRAGGDSEGRGLDNVAIGFLATYLQNAVTKDYTLDEPRLETLIVDANAFLVDGVHRVHTLHFLKGVSIAEAVNLGTVTVRPISEVEREKLASTLSVWVGKFRAGIVTDGSVVVVEQRTTSSPTNVSCTFEETKRTAEAMIAFLRIHATSSIVTICTYADKGSLWPNASAPYPPAVERAGIADTQLQPALFERWNEDQSVLLAPPPALKVALRRFELLSDHDNPDRILDQTIILEALFSDDVKQELAHKLSLRIANFLGGDFDERRAIFKTIKDGYTARSLISHGRELSATLRGIDQRVSDLLRRALSQYLTYAQRNAVTSASGEQEFIRKLDDRNLGGPPLL